MSESNCGRGTELATGLFALIVSCVPLGAALAVEAVDTTGNTRSDAVAGSLDEIVVTATKRAESLQAIPLTVEVVSQQQLQTENLSSTADLTRLVPELNYRHTGFASNDAFNIRGVETLATASGLEQSAGVAFDGVPLARPVGSIADLVDVHSVEVLMGPQGMLFGKNASAGLINIVSNTPVIGQNSVDARVAYGTLNSQQYSGTVNWGVTDNSALRVTAWKYKHDGTIHELNTNQYMNDQDSGGVRLKYAIAATDHLNLNFTGEWFSHDQNGAGYSIRSFNPSFFNFQNLGALVQQWETAHGTVAGEHNLNARGLDNPYYDRGHTNAYTLQGDYEVGKGVITGIVAYRKIVNGNSSDPFPSDNPYNQQFKNTDETTYDQWTEELRYASPIEERFRYVVGVFNFHLNLHEQTGLGFAGQFGPMPPLVTFIDTNFAEGLKNDNYAAFGEATFDITSQLHFIAGVRRSTDKVFGAMDRTGPVIAALGGPFATSTSTEYNDISWRGGLQYEFTKDIMAYLTASRGYKGPGVGYSLSTSPAEVALTHGDIVKPEIVHAYELGLKSQWFDRRLTANLSIYREIFDNFQTSVNLPGQFFSVLAITNAQQLTSTGAEINLRWQVTPSLSLLAYESYDDAHFTDYKGAGCYFGQTAAQGCVTVGTVSSQNAAGVRLADSPKESASLTARYEHPILSFGSGFGQVNTTYRSSVSYNSQGDPLVVQGGYTLVNLAAGFNSADGHWGVNVYANNVLNRHYVDMIVQNGLQDALLFNDIGYQDLRTFGIAFNVHF